MIKGKRLSFAHLEGDICVYNLTKGDSKRLRVYTLHNSKKSSNS